MHPQINKGTIAISIRFGLADRFILIEGRCDAIMMIYSNRIGFKTCLGNLR